MTASLTTRYLLTAAPRSGVVHVINMGAAHNYSNETVCGREIRDAWAGEYTEAPTGPVTCKRCKIVSDEIDAQNAEILAGVAQFPVGSHVGILVGQLSVNGPHVDRYGTVVRHIETWNGEVEYIVADVHGESVYRVYLLTADETPDNDADTHDRQAQAEADADAFMADVVELLSTSWEDMGERDVCPDCGSLDTHALDSVDMECRNCGCVWMRDESEARARSMAAHPAGKGRPSSIRDTFPGYPNAMRMEGATGRGVRWALAYDGRTIN